MCFDKQPGRLTRGIDIKRNIGDNKLLGIMGGYMEMGTELKYRGFP